MSSIARFAEMQRSLAEREVEYRKEALRQARERARNDRISMYRELNDLIRVAGVPISKICREAELSRTTIYRWLEEYDEMTIVPEVAPVATTGWTDVKLMPTGEVRATDSAGDLWLLEPNGEAWNKTNNVTVDFANWPDGARDALDSVTQAE